MDFIRKLVLAVMAIAMLVVSFFLGIFVLGAVVAIGLVVAGRIWWLKRKHLSGVNSTNQGTTIEGEYRKVDD